MSAFLAPQTLAHALHGHLRPVTAQKVSAAAAQPDVKSVGVTAYILEVGTETAAGEPADEAAERAAAKHWQTNKSASIEVRLQKA